MRNRYWFIFALALLSCLQTYAATKTSVASGNWGTANTWNPAGVPGMNDDVIIATGTTVAVNVNTSRVRNLTIQTGATLRGDGTNKILLIGKGGGEDFTNSGTLNASGSDAMTIRLFQNSQWAGTGVFNCSFVDLNNRVLTFTAANSPTINLSGAPDPFLNPGGVTPTASVTYVYNGTAAQVLPNNLSVDYGNLTIINTAGVSLKRDLFAADLLGNLTITGGGVLHLSDGVSANDITGAAGKTLTVGSGSILDVGSNTTSASLFPTGFSTFNLDETSTVQYSNSSSASQTISLVPVYGNILLTGSGTKILPAGTLSMTGNWINNQTGTLTVNGAHSVVFTSLSTIPDTIKGTTSTTFQDVEVNGPQGVVLATGATVSGTLLVDPARTLTLASGTTVVNGTLSNNGTIVNNATLTVTGTGPHNLGNTTGTGIWNLGRASGSETINLNGTFSNSGAVNLGGSGSTIINVSGSYSSSGITNFIGTGAITLSGGGPAEFGDLNILNTNLAGITPNANWAVNGDLTIGPGATFQGGSGFEHQVGENFSNNGTFGAGTSAFRFTGSGAISGSPTFYNLIIDSTAITSLASGISLGNDLTVVPGGTFNQDTNLIVGGNVFILPENSRYTVEGAFPTEFSTYDIDPTSTIRYVGNSNQVIFDFAGKAGNGDVPGYGHLVLSNSGSKSAAGDLVIRGGVSIGTGSTFNAGSYTHKVKGNWINNGTFESGTSTIIFNGIDEQSILAGGQSFTNVTVDKPSEGVSLQDNCTIAGALTLENGNILTGSNILALGPLGTLGRTNGHIVGNLRKSVSTGSPSLVFEVGDDLNYAPVSLSFGNVTVAGSLTSTTTVGDHPSVGTSGIEESQSVNRYWTVTNSGVVFDSVNLEFRFHASDIDAGSDANEFVAEKFDGSEWTALQTGARTPTNIQAMGATSFSAFAVGKKKTHDIQATANSNGSISPSGTVIVSHKADQNFTITPDTGYHILDVLVDGSSVGAVSLYTFTDVKDDHTIEASFAIDTLTIVASAGTGGSITPSGNVPVLYGGNQSFTITPDTGYHVLDVLVDGSSVGATTDYDFTNITSNASIAATFELNSYTLSTSATNGTVTINPDQATYLHGSSVELTAAPAAGYHFTGWSGGASGLTNPLTVVMDGNKNITANFAINTYTLDVTTAGSGSVAKNPDQPFYDHGTTVELTATPDVGYDFSGWSGDTSSSSNPLTVTMDGNKSVTATFTIKTYTISATAAPNGTISPSGTTVVNHGSNQTYTITPDLHYHVADVHADSVSVGVTTSYTFTSITGNHTIHADFAIDTHTLDVSIVGGGSVTKNPDQSAYDYGNTVELTATPDFGYEFAGWGGDASGASSSVNVLIDGDKSVTATFVLKTYTIVATSGLNGSISPSGNIAVTHGDSQSFLITADAGYHLMDLFVDGVHSDSVATYTFSNVMADHTIDVQFAINTYSLSVATVGGGTVVKSPDQASYDHGTSVDLTAVPDAGYDFAGWSGDISGKNPHISVLMDDNKSITATFTLKSYTISAAAGPNGSITPSGNVSVQHGSGQSFAITPDAGYHVVDVHVDSLSVGAVTTYDFTNVTADRSIVASFAIDTFQIVASSGTGGSVAPLGATSVTYGGNQSYTITPDAGYDLVDVLVDGISIGAVSNYDFNGVVADHTIHATFQLRTYSIQAIATVGGSIDPTGIVTVNHGDSQGFTFGPDAGYHLVDLLVDGTHVDSSSSYTFTAVTADHTIEAQFAINTYSLSVSASNGSVSKNPDQASYGHGTMVELTATPAAGYHFVSWSGDASGSANPLLLTMDDNKSVTANFAVNTYTIAATSTSGGSISPTGILTLNEGDSQQFAFAPDAGYHLADLLVDGVHQDSTSSYTFTNVTANHTIHVIFEQNTYIIAASASQGGTITPSGNVAVVHGNDRQFTWNADPGYHFVGLLVDSNHIDSINSYTFVNVTGNHDIVANFAINTYTLSVNGTNGSVSKNPDQPSYPFGSAVELTATPDPGYVFAGWSGDAFGNANPLTVLMDDNKSITANFAINTYSITATATPGGFINPSGILTVNEGGQQQFTFGADPGYHLVDLLVDGVHQDSVSSYTFANVTADHSIHLAFAPNVYTVTAGATQGGSISPSGAVNVTQGGNRQFTWSEDPGYHFVELLVDGVHSDSTTSYTFSNVQSDHTIQANFAINTYTLTVNAVHGTVTKNPDQATYEHGTTVIVSATPDPGYEFVGWAGDVNGTVNPFVLPMDANYNVTANFVAITHTIAAGASVGGSINPSGAVVVNEGSNQTFTWLADPGYTFDELLIDGVHVDSTSSYTFTNVLTNHSIQANFTPNLYTITATATAGGTITPSGNVTVAHGTNAHFTLTPDAGYELADLLVDGLHVDSTTSYTFVSVTGGHTLHAVFQLKQYSITAIAGTGGSIAPAGIVSVTHGGSQQFVVSVDEGYLLDNLLVDGTHVDSTTSYTFTNVTADHSIQATFRLKSYTITASSGLGGSINPSGAVQVAHGGSATFAIIPDAGYHLTDLLVDGVHSDSVTSFTFVNVTANHGISASFALNTYTITATAGAGGSISPSGSTVVNYGDSLKFTMTPDSGYQVADVLVDGISIGAPLKHTFYSISANHTIHASFSAIPPVNRPPTAVRLISPANGSNIMIGDIWLMYFTWSSSTDPDPGDTVHAALHIFGPGFDTTVFMNNTGDTTSEFWADRFVDGNSYQWTVWVSDEEFVVASPDTFSFTIDFVNGVREIAGIPKEFRVHQNYPNPFNPSTVIRFELPEQSTVTVRVYNSLGEEVARLLDENTLNAGIKEMNFDAATLPSGVYFYRLEARGNNGRSFNDVRKMLLVK